jgi:hypothetical protein
MLYSVYMYVQRWILSRLQNYKTVLEANGTQCTLFSSGPLIKEEKNLMFHFVT